VIDRTCGRVARALQVGFAIDAHAYFTALAEALRGARHSVWILGWDIHSRVVLQRGTPDAPDLRTLLDQLVRRRPALDVRVLVWDHALLYTLEREFLPIYSLGFSTHRRVRFHQDGQHPLGACHHQKLVVIDDDLAFCGGLDLTVRRWDSPEHRPGDDDRRDHQGRPYGPFHDAQVAVQGPAAALLGEEARRRWRAATGRRVKAKPAGKVPWPESLAVDLEDVDVGMALTLPAHRGSEAVREIEALYRDAIASARDCIYIESQYLTADSIANALASRLHESDGPEVILVGPRYASGWLEEATIGALRAQVIGRLRAADTHGRLRLWYPRAAAQPVYVHSKLAIFDDRLVTIGSANICNRSMSLDSECNVAFEGDASSAIPQAARRLRARLLAEHLGTDPERFEAAVREHGSLIAAVESLRGGERSLEPMERPELTELQLSLLNGLDIVDPEGPIQPDAFVEEIVPDEAKPRGRGRYFRIGLVVLVVAGLAAVWRLTPLSELVTAETLAAWMAPTRAAWWGPLVTWCVFVVGGLLFFPVTALIVYAAIVHGPWVGFATALAGVLGSATLTYGLGAALGRQRVRRLAGPRLNRISRRLARRGILAVLAVRILPVAPFTLINVVAGASHVGFRDYLIGTVLGVLPGIVAMTVLGDRLWSFVTEPTLESSLALATLVLAFIAGVALLARRLARASG